MNAVQITAIALLVCGAIGFGTLCAQPGKQVTKTYGERWFDWCLGMAIWIWVLWAAGRIS